MALTVDVISDVICPWCYIGKRRLEKAIRTWNGKQAVQVRWHPFQLNQNIPKVGLNRKDYRTAKFGSWERSLELDRQVGAVGETEGISFAFDRIERTPNTLDAHRLIWLAERQGVQDAVVEGLFRGYFTEGRNIADRQTLLEIATIAGLDRSLVESVLDGDESIAAIREAEKKAHRVGVQGVPFFVVNGGVALSGAQEAGIFHAAFEQAGASSGDEASVCAVGAGGQPSC